MIKNFFERIADLIAPALRERRLDAERRADLDGLTNLANRTAFDRAEPWATNDPHTAFIIFDANSFGLLNKYCGHATGDQLLQFYADVLAEIARRVNCRVFRLGGDEFVIICRISLAERVRDCAEQCTSSFRSSDFTVSLSGAIGATLPQADSRLQARKKARKSADQKFLASKR